VPAVHWSLPSTTLHRCYSFRWAAEHHLEMDSAAARTETRELPRQTCDEVVLLTDGQDETERTLLHHTRPLNCQWTVKRTTEIHSSLARKSSNISYTFHEWVSRFVTDWIGLCSVLRPRQHSIGYMGNGFYRSKDSTNSIIVLKEMLQKRKQTTKTTKYTYAQRIMYTKKDIYKISTTSPLVYTNMGWLGDSSHRGQGR